MAAPEGTRPCQSCGMPLECDEQGGDTDADGTKSAIYCSHRHEEGDIPQSGITDRQTRALVKEKLEEFGFPGSPAGIHARGIPRLGRRPG